jgi:hypothetical protein
MDTDQIDYALHEITQMVLVAIGAHESLMGMEADPGIFQMPARDAEMLSFSVFDLQKRVEALRASLYPAAQLAKAPVLTLVRSVPDLSA